MKKFTLRIPDDLHEAIRLSAEREQRSMHGQIIWLLRKALEQERN